MNWIFFPNYIFVKKKRSEIAMLYNYDYRKKICIMSYVDRVNTMSPTFADWQDRLLNDECHIQAVSVFWTETSENLRKGQLPCMKSLWVTCILQDDNRLSVAPQLQHVSQNCTSHQPQLGALMCMTFSCICWLAVGCQGLTEIPGRR